jgi:hypothetical protein
MVADRIRRIGIRSWIGKLRGNGEFRQFGELSIRSERKRQRCERD